MLPHVALVNITFNFDIYLLGNVNFEIYLMGNKSFRINPKYIVNLNNYSMGNMDYDYAQLAT